MAFDQLIGDSERSAEQLFGGPNFLRNEGKQLRIGEIERCREMNREIVAQPVLRERRAMAICDLPAGCGNI